MSTQKVPDTQDLWYIEDRTDVADWLTDHNWEVSAVESIDLMTRYGRCGRRSRTTPRPSHGVPRGSSGLLATPTTPR